jgi:L-threonylcarbamoyladenylate synthase
VRSPIDAASGAGLGALHSPTPIQEDAVLRAAEALRAGQVVAIPTDTVYGLAAVIDRPDAIDRLFAIKGRAVEKAIPILISDPAHVHKLTPRLSPTAEHLAGTFWPGGLTLVLAALSDLPRGVTTMTSDGTETVAVRVPDNALARSIIAAAGGVLAVTSANRSGAAPALDAAEVSALGLPRPIAIVDGGRATGGVPSTIVDATTDTPEILREGAIPASAIAAALANLQAGAIAEMRARYDQDMLRQQAGDDATDLTR